MRAISLASEKIFFVVYTMGVGFWVLNGDVNLMLGWEIQGIRTDGESKLDGGETGTSVERPLVDTNREFMWLK